MENKKIYGMICYLQRQMSRENNIIFAEYGLTPVQLHVLVHVNKSLQKGFSVCQRDIEKFLGMRPSSVSTLLGNLEKDGFILRTQSDGDARMKYLTLTEKGKNLCMKNKLLMDRCDDAIQSALNEEEQETFKTLLSKIIDANNTEREVKN